MYIVLCLSKGIKGKVFLVLVEGSPKCEQQLSRPFVLVGGGVWGTSAAFPSWEEGRVVEPPDPGTEGPCQGGFVSLGSSPKRDEGSSGLRSDTCSSDGR